MRVTAVASLREAQEKLPGHEAVVLSRRAVAAADPETRKAFASAVRQYPLVVAGGRQGHLPTSWFKRGGAFYLKAPFSGDDLLHFLKKAVAVHALEQEVQGLREEVDQKARELGFYKDVGKALTSSLDLRTILNIVMEKTRELIRAEAWSILLVDEETQELVFQVAKGRKGKQVEKLRLKMGQGIAGWVAQHGKPAIVPDTSKDERFYRGVDQMTRFHTRSILAVPMVSKDRVIGVLEVINKQGGAPFTQQDLELLLKLVDQAAIAVEHAALYQRVAEQAVTDDLTQLFNLRYLNRTIDMEIERCQRYGSSVSLIFMDLDFFKDINDQYGHLMGSKVLVEVAQLLLKNLRSIDVVARYGGDEFVVVLPQTGVQAARTIAERLRRVLATSTFLRSEGLAVKLTASFGIAAYPDHARNREELLRLADEAMYRVKHETRNRVYIVA